MQITTLKQSLPYLMKANITALLWGHFGIGKSQAVAQFCEENEYKFVDLRLGTQEVGDLLGLADFTTDKEGNKVATKFMSPDWLVSLISYCNENPKSAAIIFLDELNRARRDVLQAVFQLVLDKRMHTVKLPPNCYVMAASNPNTEDYIVADIGDKAFMDRFCHIKLTPSSKEWFEYADSKNFDNDLVNFLKSQPDMLQSKLTDFNLDDVKPSRRSWEMVNKLIKAKTPTNLLQELSFGLVGHTATIAFIESMKNSDKPLTADDILNNYTEVRTKVKSYSNSDTGGRSDLLNYTGDNVVKFAEKSQKNLTKAQEENLDKFLTDIPTDLAFSLCRSLYRRPTFKNCIDNNETLKKMFLKAKNIKSK